MTSKTFKISSLTKHKNIGSNSRLNQHGTRTRPVTHTRKNNSRDIKGVLYEAKKHSGIGGIGISAGGYIEYNGESIKIATANLFGGNIENVEYIRNKFKSKLSSNDKHKLTKQFVTNIVEPDILLTQESNHYEELPSYVAKVYGAHGEKVGVFIRDKYIKETKTITNGVYTYTSNLCDTPRTVIGIKLNHHVNNCKLNIANFHLCGGRFDDTVYFSKFNRKVIIGKLDLINMTLHKQPHINIIVGDFNSDINMYNYVKKIGTNTGTNDVIKYINENICRKISYTDVGKTKVMVSNSVMKTLYNMIYKISSRLIIRFRMAYNYCMGLANNSDNIDYFISYVLWNIMPFVYLIDYREFNLLNGYKNKRNTSFFNNTPDIILVNKYILNNYYVIDKLQYYTFDKYFTMKNKQVNGVSDHDILAVTLVPK